MSEDCDKVPVEVDGLVEGEQHGVAYLHHSVLTLRGDKHVAHLCTCNHDNKGGGAMTTKDNSTIERRGRQDKTQENGRERERDDVTILLICPKNPGA